MQTLARMTVQECWQALGGEGVGRVGFDRGRGPRIHPVNYTVVDEELYVRTTEESEFGAFITMFSPGAWVPFEVDQLDATAGEQWSVLVCARVGRLDADPRATTSEDGPLPVPDPPGPHPLLVRLMPIEITGRRLTEDRYAARPG